MKKQTGIWIDKEKAILITLFNGDHVIKNIESDIVTKERDSGESKDFTKFGNQFLNSEKKKANKLKQQTDNYLGKVILDIKKSDEVVIFGPAKMKTELEKVIRNNNDVSGKLLEVKTVDKMTENQLVAWVKEYFT
jgi:hypothetical protein